MSTICAAPAQMPHRRRAALRSLSYTRLCSSNDVVQTNEMINELPSSPDEEFAKPIYSRSTSSYSVNSSSSSPTSPYFASPTSSIFSFRTSSSSNPSSPTSPGFSLRGARDSLASLSNSMTASSSSGNRKAKAVGQAVRKLGPGSSNPDVEAMQPPTSLSSVAATEGPRRYVPRRAKSGFMASVTPLAERDEF